MNTTENRVQEHELSPSCHSFAGDAFPEPRGWAMAWAPDGLMRPQAPRSIIHEREEATN